MKKIKLGIIGVGHMGQYHINVASTLKNKFTLSGIFDINAERVKEMSDKYETKYYERIEYMMEDVDAVIIAVPTYLHYKYAQLAIENNLHVLVEKPVTENIEHARELATNAKRKGLVFQVSLP